MLQFQRLPPKFVVRGGVGLAVEQPRFRGTEAQSGAQPVFADRFAIFPV